MLKIAFRNFWKYKTFSLINLFGLAIGMAGSLTLFIWIQNQISVDQFHKDSENIIKVYVNYLKNGSVTTTDVIPVSFEQSLRQQPEIQCISKVKQENLLLTAGENKLRTTGLYADQSFLDIFNFPLLEGNWVDLRSNPGILITQKLEASLFHKESGLNKIISVGNVSYKVLGIVKNLPNNTQFNFDFLLPWQSLTPQGLDNAVQDNTAMMFAKIKPGTDITSINQRLASYIKRPEIKIDKGIFFLYSFPKTWLYGTFENGKPAGGYITLVRMIGIIAIILLLIACINFINLSTARSLQRVKEVGLRKVIGGTKTSLIWQFICESMLVSLIAGFIALYIVINALPYFNQITEKQLAINFGSLYFWLFFILFIIITGFLAGLYPAFFLSSFIPVKALKGIFENSNRFFTPGRVLFVFQFVIAVVLINFVLLIQKQVDHLKTRELGYDKEHLVYQSLNNDLRRNYAPLKNDLIKSGKVEALSLSNVPVSKTIAASTNISWNGIKKEDGQSDFSVFLAQDNFLKTNGIHLVAGRELNEAELKGDINACLINETAAGLFHFEQPLNEFVSIENKRFGIVGIVKDFVTSSALLPINPVIIKGGSETNFINIRIRKTDNYLDDLSAVSAIIKKYNPDDITELKFADWDYEQKIKGLNLTSELANIFAGLTIFISCMGLLGLVMYKTETKSKEISIRKVFGASAISILGVLSKNFLKMVLLAILIGSPVAWLLMNSFLRPLYYRVYLNPIILIEGGVLALIITIITIGTQSLKAALSNPIKGLREE